MKSSRTWALVTAALVIWGAVMVWTVFTTVMRTGGTPWLAAAVGFAVLITGCVGLYVIEKPPPPADPVPDRPHVLVDWHLSDVCLTVTCPCPQSRQQARHVDGYTFGRFRCPDCGEQYQLPEIVRAHSPTERN